MRNEILHPFNITLKMGVDCFILYVLRQKIRKQKLQPVGHKHFPNWISSYVVSWMQSLFVAVFPMHLKLSTISKDLLRIIIYWIWSAMSWQNMDLSPCLIFSVFISLLLLTDISVIKHEIFYSKALYEHQSNFRNFIYQWKYYWSDSVALYITMW